MALTIAENMDALYTIFPNGKYLIIDEDKMVYVEYPVGCGIPYV
jgi:hypothetical protein